jgi:hypothetical protein
VDTTCSGPWQRSIEARAAGWRCGRLTEAPQRPSGRRSCGLTAACQAPTSIFDGSSTGELRRHGVGVGCDQAETPRHTLATLLAAAAVGVFKFGKKA